MPVRLVLLLILLTACVMPLRPASAADFDALMRRAGLVDVGALDRGFTVRLMYATTDNFVGRNMYGTLRRAYLTRATAESLLRALEQLHRVDPDLGFIIYDAARPLSVQRAMWRAVAGTPNERYVARPHRGGPHNYGIAVDIGLTYRGRPLDMGTPFDTFTPEAHITAEAALVRQGKISPRAYHNRRLLRKVLTDNGFQTFSREWWHFTRHTMPYTRAHCTLLDF